jgi:Zn ribbon nucleic-acid-binding protein
MKCPKCGASEDDLDYWVNNKGLFVWTCFECEHEWTTTPEEV